MKFFTSTTHQRIYERITAVVVIITVMLSAAPHTVDARTQEVVESALSFAQEEPPDFPVSSSREPVRTVRILMTAYSSDVFQTDDTPCITANGYNLCDEYTERGYRNTIATNMLPFNTQVRFPELYGDKIFIVRDRMNTRYNGQYRTDIWMLTKQEAKQFGAKVVEMEIY